MECFWVHSHQWRWECVQWKLLMVVKIWMWGFVTVSKLKAHFKMSHRSILEVSLSSSKLLKWSPSVLKQLDWRFMILILYWRTLMWICRCTDAFDAWLRLCLEKGKCVTKLTSDLTGIMWDILKSRHNSLKRCVLPYSLRYLHCSHFAQVVWLKSS